MISTISTLTPLPGRLSLTLAQASEATGYSKRTLTRLNQRGLIKFSRAARRITIRVEELNRFLGACEDSSLTL